MIKIIFNFLAILFLMITAPVMARVVPPSHLVDYNIVEDNKFAVRLDVQNRGVYPFECDKRVYHSDILLPKRFTCKAQLLNDASGYDAGKILRVSSINSASKVETIEHIFLLLADNSMYRIKDTGFLYNEMLNDYFQRELGIPESFDGVTNITLQRFSNTEVFKYNQEFCVRKHLKLPFSGKVEWCQQDNILRGLVRYYPKALDFSRASLLAQDYIYENNFVLKSKNILSNDTVIALNIGEGGRYYYAFSVLADSLLGYLKAYDIRIYMNGTVELLELQEIIRSADKL